MVLTGTSGNDTIILGSGSNASLGSGDDIVSGSGGNDIIDAGGGNDRLTGNSGIDTLTGGPGNDTFIDTISGLNGDTIRDFTIGDRIVITDAIRSTFQFTFTNSVIAFGTARLNVPGVNPGANILVTAAAEGGVQLVIQPQFGVPSFVVNGFGSNAAAGGWTSADRYPRQMADVNGDGRPDIVGFGEEGVYVSLANGAGSFDPARLATTGFGAGARAGGWSSNDVFHRDLADVNGDGRADIVGFGGNGVYVAFANADGTFAAPFLATTGFGANAGAGGWSSDDRFHRDLADVNGDGRADIIGFGNNGVYVALANANGTFAAPTLAVAAYGSATGAGGWSSNERFLRQVADVNGDGRADIIGFGNDGVFVSLAQANGTFGAPILGLRQFGSAPQGGGWTLDSVFPRMIGDVNHDGKADIVGFGNDGVYIALGHGNGTFDNAMLDIGAYGASGAAGAWTSTAAYPRQIIDVNGDGAADIVGFASTGVFVSLSSGDIWS